MSANIPEEVSWKLEVINGSLVRCVCYVLVEHYLVQEEGRRMQDKLNRTAKKKMNTYFYLRKILANRLNLIN